MSFSFVFFSRDTTLPRSSARKIENEGEGESENDAFVSKYCVRICIARKCRSTIFSHSIDLLMNHIVNSKNK